MLLNFTPECDQRHEGKCNGPMYRYRSNSPLYRCEYHAKWVDAWVRIESRNRSLPMNAWLATLSDEERAQFERRVAGSTVNGRNWELIEELQQ